MYPRCDVCGCPCQQLYSVTLMTGPTERRRSVARAIVCSPLCLHTVALDPTHWLAPTPYPEA